MRILVIEDSPVDFRLIERALGDGAVLSHATSLAGGVEAARGQSFDLIILDLTLDDSRGYETFEKVHAAIPDIPVLVLSGLDDDDLACRAVANGAQDFIRKASLLNCSLDRVARYAIERHRAEFRSRAADARYRRLFDNLPTAAYTCNAEGLITYFNPPAAEIWGQIPRLNDSAYRYCGAQRLRAADGTDLPHNQSWVAKAIRERRSFHACEYFIQRPGGELRSVLVNATPDFDEDGALVGCIAVIVDVTEQRRFERELRESERFARSTVNSLATHIAILDATGTIIAVNDAWKNFADRNLGFGADYGVGTSYLEVCDRAAATGDNIAGDAAAGIRSVLQRRRQSFELEYPCHSPQEERWFMLRTTLFEGDGPTRAVVAHENITSRIVAERLAREQCGLREAVAGMEQVLGVVGHELRTPLAALRAISEFLTTDGAKDSAEADRFIEIISEEVDRMSDTVNNLLEAARLNSGRARWNWSEIDPAELIEDAAASIQPLLNGSSVRLSTCVEGPHQIILGDKEAIGRLIINLLSNARKHTAEGEIGVCCRQFADADGAWIDFVVSDTGCGIAPEISKKLGEAFALNSGVVGKDHVSGTGLGLAICKGIAEAHGGRILIESTPGLGTKVTARLRSELDAATTGDTDFAGRQLEAAA